MALVVVIARPLGGFFSPTLQEFTVLHREDDKPIPPDASLQFSSRQEGFLGGFKGLNGSSGLLLLEFDLLGMCHTLPCLLWRQFGTLAVLAVATTWFRADIIHATVPDGDF
ncbi:hypothetical protein Ae201684P_004604 [Aphanomyces euteiches]|uniref:Uncharacterized protein n=1 Tax=Aphanomyces euteiches TaxID=100861 RepID=A0A6G0XCZ9_9STRA|nr:hypothetical protein Ae201684_006052 [Aphanomyces euteiches]KAH9068906.1 hypothetical protein Ae201684P_004604 [Aphanomyces euteiches]KAH9156314.1 hypothetical protein AeRB84_001776 [Aphanomyces euteiches]